MKWKYLVYFGSVLKRCFYFDLFDMVKMLKCFLFEILVWVNLEEISVFVRYFRYKVWNGDIVEWKIDLNYVEKFGSSYCN